MNKSLGTLWVLVVCGLFSVQGQWLEAQVTKSPAKVDLNTATAEELEQLPGVGPATAEKIIASRPYEAIDDLKNAGVSESKIGIPEATIVKITPLVTVEATEANGNPIAKTPPKPGMVWVNTDSKIFHKDGDRWYGRTVKGNG